MVHLQVKEEPHPLMWFLLIVPLSLMIAAFFYQAILGYTATPMGGNEMAEKPHLILNISHNSESMMPLFNSYDQVIVEPFTNISNLSIMDLVVYKLRNETILHRIVYISNGTDGMVITKGDANFLLDEPIIRENIIYKVKEIRYA